VESDLYSVVSINVNVGPLQILERFVVEPAVARELGSLQAPEGFTIVSTQQLKVSDRAAVLAVVRSLRDL